jgi:hypothetical protein
MMHSRFLRFFLLALLIVAVPSFVYLSHSKSGVVRDPRTGELLTDDSYKQGTRPAQLEQGNEPGSTYRYLDKVPKLDIAKIWSILAKSRAASLPTSTKSPTTLSPTETTSSAAAKVTEEAVPGAYAPKMSNATVKYVLGGYANR